MVKLTDVTGIGPATIKVLAEHKIKTVEALAAISLTDLQKIPGFSGAIRARAVKQSAVDCLQDKPVKPSATPVGRTQTKIKEAPSIKTRTSPIVSQLESVKLNSESKKKKHKVEKQKDKIKDKKKKDGKKKKKNQKKS
ncbi:helix-hairpin-helix domain-containing protein [uncultured Nitrosomonas sp.]|uniref:helix-hairpin-helix domain-containing protein n=1 Tax=uncultured Nitrosomonas sp. TaxID=156424 RepID=UPI0025F6D0A2|nr:helix-hairpin-helix domain-containing protein [uncultured Nitrosomonas sp.]